MRVTRRGQAGSVLLLVPAGVLVLVVLGAIAVDSAVAFLAQRELAGTAAAVANDAAAAALAEGAFYDEGPVRIDESVVRRLVEKALADRTPRGVSDVVADVQVPGRQVCVVLTGRVDFIFARAVPGAARGTTVTGRAAATAVEGPAGSPVARSTSAACS